MTKEHWNMTIHLAEKKMRSSLKQLQEEHVMWQVLSQEAGLRVDAMTNEIHHHKSYGRKLVQMQVEKGIQRERTLKSYMSKLQSIHSALLLKERKAKVVAIQSSKHWKKVATNRMDKITKLPEQSNELKDT
jgi:hypothetical protein